MEILHPDPRSGRETVPVYAKERGKTVFLFQPPDSICAIQAPENVFVPYYSKKEHDTLSLTVVLLDAASLDSEVRADSFVEAVERGRDILRKKGLEASLVVAGKAHYDSVGLEKPAWSSQILCHDAVPDGVVFVLPEAKEVGFAPMVDMDHAGLVIMKPENVIRVRWRDAAEDHGESLWTVVGIYVGGDHEGKPFTCYLGGMSAEEAKEAAEKTNADRGDAVRVLACVPGGKPATVFGVTGS